MMMKSCKLIFFPSTIATTTTTTVHLLIGNPI